MAAWGSNINEAIRQGTADQGFWKDYDLFNIVRDEAGLILTGSTSPVLALASDVLSISWAAANVDAMYAKIRLTDHLALLASKAAATINIPFPRFKLNALLLSAGDTNTPRITVTAKLRAAAGAVKATFTPTSIEADGTTLTNGTCKPLLTNTLAVNPELRTWNFFETYGTGPVYAAPGDYLDLKIVPGTHGTDAIGLHGIWLQVAENIRQTDPSLSQ